MSSAKRWTARRRTSTPARRPREPSRPRLSRLYVGPVPSAVACQYLLPSGRPPNDDPRLDPMTWDRDKVSVEMWVTQVFDDQGFYMPSAAACGMNDGWYYVEPDGGEP